MDFQTKAGSTVEQTLNQLENAIISAGLNIELVRPETSVGANGGYRNAPQMLTLRHKEFGSDHSFQVASNTAGLLSAVEEVSHKVQNELDVAGEIAGEGAIGRGQVLTGAGGFGSKAEGIIIRYDGVKHHLPDSELDQ